MDEVATILVGVRLVFYSKSDAFFWRTADAGAGLVAWKDTDLTYTPGNRCGALHRWFKQCLGRLHCTSTLRSY